MPQMDDGPTDGCTSATMMVGNSRSGSRATRSSTTASPIPPRRRQPSAARAFRGDARARLSLLVGATSEPTLFPALNAVLDELVAGARAVLVGNFCGAYLVGSFAVGDADEHSDVDFIVATHRDLTELEQEGLQTLHRSLYELPAAWAQHLEGSYAPKNALRSIDPARQAFFYLDNGARELMWDNC